MYNAIMTIPIVQERYAIICGACFINDTEVNVLCMSFLWNALVLRLISANRLMWFNGVMYLYIQW